VDAICNQQQAPQIQPNFGTNSQSIEVLADIYFNLPARNQLKKAVSRLMCDLIMDITFLISLIALDI